MEFDELLITTGVDALVRLVKEKQRIELEDASSTLNIPTETLEEWARILEEENILRIEYRLTKIYLTWLKPSDEELSSERESFYEEKKDVETKVAEFKQKINMETVELNDLKKSFTEFYGKMYSKVEDLEKKIATVPAAKVLSDDSLSKNLTELGALDNKLTEIKLALTEIRGDVNAIPLKKVAPSEELIGKINANNSEIADLRKELEELRKKMTMQEGKDGLNLPTIKDVKKKFDSIQSEFAALRSKNAQIREDMLSLHESSEILKTVTESIMGQEDKITIMRKEAQEIAREISTLAEKSNKLNQEAKHNLDLMERLGSSVDVAKSILNKFPSQQSVLAALDKLQADENSILEKNESLGKIIDAAGGKQITARQASELIRKLEEKIEQTKQEMDSLEATLNEEKGTYLTFQKIKERIVPSIEAYQSQLDSMEQRMGKIRDETRDQVKSIKADAQKLEAALKDESQLGELVKSAQDIKQKKKLLDDIRSSFDDLSVISDNLNKRAILLANEAKLLEIRASPSAGAAGQPTNQEAKEQKEKGVKQQLELSQDEELEFRKKREELKKLIQKLWEE